MKFTWIALPGVLLLSACSSSQPNAPRPPRIGMPNPAAVYCEQQGGTPSRGLGDVYKRQIKNNLIMSFMRRKKICFS